MANAEVLAKWSHRKCLSCGSPGFVQRYELVPDLDIAANYPITVADFHDTCIGGWLMKNVGCAVQFKPGEIP